MTVLVGCDPELFVKLGENKYRSAHGLIPGTKETPHKVNKGAVQVDGLALEFNTDPASTEDEFVENISAVLSELRKMVDPKYEFDFCATANFHASHLKAQPEEALELGCEPDFNAYTLEENPRPDGTVNFRTASGHVHIGFTEGADPTDPEHIDRCATLVKHLDVFLGLPSLLWDTDVKRRRLYGKAGAHRIKSYGVEYRTLSNRWLTDERLVRYVFQQVQASITSLKSGKRFDEYAATVQHAINNSYNHVGGVKVPSFLAYNGVALPPTYEKPVAKSKSFQHLDEMVAVPIQFVPRVRIA